MHEKRGLERDTGRIGKVNGIPMAPENIYIYILEAELQEEMNNRRPCYLVQLKRKELQKVSCRCEVVVGENGFEDNRSPLSLCKILEIRFWQVNVQLPSLSLEVLTFFCI